MKNYPFQNPELSPSERVRDLLSRLTIDEKIGFLSTHNQPVERLNIGEWFVGQEVARGLVKREQENPTTVFPQPIGMSASFDPDMMLEIGKTVGREARAYYNEDKRGGLMVWGPTVDLCRDPRWGRVEECYGEDPYLTGVMSSAYTKGLRGDGKVWATIPTLKHFCANNHEQDRGVDNANLSPRLKHEYYYEAFRRPIVEGGAYSVMAAYNDICHTPAVMNHDLKNVLKKQWGLGFIVTDGGDFSQNVTFHQVFDSHAKALQACLYAGADTMTDEFSFVQASARKALEMGYISESDVDNAIGSLLESRVLLGHFDPETPFDHLTRADVNTDADKALNFRACREGMVLLENDGTLPLNPEKVKKIGLFGANADCNLMDWYTGISNYLISVKKGLEEKGFDVIYDIGWDIVKIQAPNEKFIRVGEDGFLYADSDKEHADEFYWCLHDSIENGHSKWSNLKHVKSGKFVHIPENAPCLGKTEIYGWFTSETFHVDWDRRRGHMISDYLHGRQFCLDENQKVVCRPKQRPNETTAFYLECVSGASLRLNQLAKDCDVVVYCGGNDPEQLARECYDRETIDLPDVQADCLCVLCSQNEVPVILLLVSSYPYALFPFQEIANANAILWTSHAGAELGHAVAETLFGENNPAGRLPLTWYACDEDLPNIKDYDIMSTKMTYRYFDGAVQYPFGHGLSYSKFKYSNMQTAVTSEGVRISADIANVSDRDGDEVVQVYYHAVSKRIIRPDLQLCAFQRMHIKAGETVKFETVIPFAEFQFYDVSREKFCLETGEYEISVGASSFDLHCVRTVTIEGETVPPRDLSKEIRAELYDTQKNTEIYTNPLSGVTHVRGMRWDNSIIFQNCDLTGVKAVTVWASAIVQPQTITIDCNHQKLTEILVPSCDGYEDFRKLTASVEIDGCHDLELMFGEGVSIRSIQISR